MASNEAQVSPRPLQVNIVGAGLGGLTAAIALRRSGHKVQIFEGSEKKTELGNGITLQVNGLRVLHQLGFSSRNLQGAEYDGIVRFDAHTGSGTLHSWGARSTEDNDFRAMACHRSDFRDELERLATAKEGQGMPAQLHLDSKVVVWKYHFGQWRDHFRGSCAASKSTIRTSIVGHPVRPLPCGLSCVRFLLDASGVNDIPDLGWLTDNPHANKGIQWPGEERRLIYTYPVRNRTLINFVGFFADEDQAKPDWVPSATRQDVLNKFHDAHPKFLRLLDLPIVSPTLKWKLRTVPILRTWIRGRAVLLGDSAHATIPYMGQGSAMAIEDAGVLGVLLPFGTTQDAIYSRLAAYEMLRKERGEFVNKQSLDRALSNNGDGTFRPQSQDSETQARVLKHDAIQVAQEYLSMHFGGETGVRNTL
ncbi:hypothetical protein FB45DRAFT_1141726 [Roridomyces roridus]|uniref:FAD-binding domain-containing protein n=1 Tax=Roridomyces roridus TaxID=1738132 RepID=A0AAD7BZ01_9AGAR|nr:hypothetical protein FB45DRAFT_1141726 [Roridomyces roridus]